ncbi:MAG: nucleoside triphosphate pyrophosphohydrolase [Actinomycetota bacterium]
MTARVVVVGLGPAGADLMLPAARAALETASVRLARTARHPAVAELVREGLKFETLDELYERGSDLEEVYAAIAHRVVDAANDHGAVAYAVPGNPAVAERTVALLRDAAATGSIELEVMPGLSFAELAWARLGVDPMEGVAIVDARDFEVGGPMLVAQCDSKLVLSDVKLALLEALPPGAPVTVLQRLGLPDEEVRTVALEDLDRVVDPDHLTSIYVEAPGRAAARELARLLALAERLRRPGGCPWDAEQSHHSLTRYLLEEAYEVVEAVERLPSAAPGGEVPPQSYAALEDELGDLLYQVIFHAVLAEEADAFTMADVARGIHDKLVRRHPHVFGDVAAGTSSDVMRNWEQIKKNEKGSASIVAGITPGLPSLLYAHKLFRKAASIGLDPGSAADARDRLSGTVARLERADEAAEVEDALGELLAAAVVLARSAGIDAESVLRGWAARFRERFEAMEALAVERGMDLAAVEPGEVEQLWGEVSRA